MRETHTQYLITNLNSMEDNSRVDFSTSRPLNMVSSAIHFNHKMDNRNKVDMAISNLNRVLGASSSQAKIQNGCMEDLGITILKTKVLGVFSRC